MKSSAILPESMGTVLIGIAIMNLLLLCEGTKFEPIMQELSYQPKWIDVANKKYKRIGIRD